MQVEDDPPCAKRTVMEENFGIGVLRRLAIA